jgi:hypothetical protein
MMKQSVLLALIAGSASAFTTTNVSPRTVVTQSAVMDDMVGAVDLRGKEFKYDPVRNTIICSMP